MRGALETWSIREVVTRFFHRHIRNILMRFIGADLHKKSITFCVVEKAADGIRVVARKRIMCSEVRRIEEFLKASVPCQLTVEATIGYEWFAGVAERIAERVVIAHAGKLRIIAESTRKTDKVDAYVLAEFLAHGMIPEAWRPTPRVRQHRALIRRRCKVQNRITSIKNTIRGILTRYNSDISGLFTAAGREHFDSRCARRSDARAYACHPGAPIHQHQR